MDDGAPQAPTPDEALANVAAAITGDWAQIAAVWQEFRGKYGYYLRPDVDADRQGFLREALWLALGRGHLRALLMRLNERGLASADIHAAAEPLVGTGFQFQAYVNGEWKPQRAVVAGRRLMEACDHVCRIAVGGQHRGTGVLIRPTVVATAAHVVAGLVDAQGRAKPGSLAKLAITFFDADDLLPNEAVQESRAVVAQLHPDWLAYQSPPAPGEGGGVYGIDCVDGITRAAGPWDLALIRLAEPPRIGLSGHRLRGGEPPDAAFGVHVLHHPGDPLGAPMGLLWSIGEVTQALGDPPLRWLHDANTDAGSSGAPCFDDTWRVVGLHQAGASQINTPDQANRAVPIYPWADQVDLLAQAADSTPYLIEAAAEDGALTPVLGRLDVQAQIWRAMRQRAPADDRAVLVYGGPRSGRTFTGAILRALAAKAGGRVIALDARNAQGQDALGFAQSLVGAAGAALPQQEVRPSGLTTELRDLRSEITPVLIRELETLSGGSPLWLFVDGLEAADRISPSGAAQVVESVLASLALAPQLRLLLVGWNGVSDGIWQEWLPPGPVDADIAQYLWRAFAPPGAVPPAQALSTFEVLAAAELAKQPAHLDPYARALAATHELIGVVRGLIAIHAPASAGGDGS